MNKSRLYGNIISASLARYKTRQAYWKKANPVNRDKPNKEEDDRNKRGYVSRQGNLNSPSLNNEKEEIVGGSGEMKVGKEVNNLVGEKRRGISGHIESEDLWKLKRCLIGKMQTIVSLETVRSRLHD
ncbi:hypothetical protein V6N13_019826 [Hibiscus sabdariffa]|uniref:Uncharacterized protein n=1 Tax=Hibiscus sabdariffa TaxID=183260 RepID=A0ABR2ERH6_9ROSI